MKYAVEMGSGAMIYVHTKFHKEWFRYSTADRGGGLHRDTDSKVIL
jgi:hypothetical protein